MLWWRDRTDHSTSHPDATSDVVPGLAKPGGIGMKPPPKAAAPPTAASPTPASPVPVPSGDSISADAVKNLKD
eukprot:g15364.t1